MTAVMPTTSSATGEVSAPVAPTPPSTARPTSRANGFRRKWLTHANQALRYYAYYVTPLVNNLYGGRTVRRVTIMYHLDDDRVSVFESHRTCAPGFQPGALVKKHRPYQARHG
jgi:uncharacterized protein YcaQ